MSLLTEEFKRTLNEGNSWSMFWETFNDPISLREIRKYSNIYQWMRSELHHDNRQMIS